MQRKRRKLRKRRKKKVVVVVVAVVAVMAACVVVVLVVCIGLVHGRADARRAAALRRPATRTLSELVRRSGARWRPRRPVAGPQTTAASIRVALRDG